MGLCSCLFYMGAVKKWDSVSWHRMNKEAENGILGWGKSSQQ